MRLVAITDIHGKVGMTKALSKVLADEDLSALLIAGDLTHFSGSHAAMEVLTPLLNLDVPLIAVHGNCDGKDVPDLLDELGISVHKRRVEIDGAGIVGIGGSNITPFHTIWELREDEIGDILNSNYRPGDVILSHVPPYGTVADRVHSGLHVGSRTLRKFIELKRPPLVVCGHIHEGRGIEWVGETLVVNPGPLFRGYYAVVEFDEKERKAENVELRKL